jgi:hypothetical protein
MSGNISVSLSLSVFVSVSQTNAHKGRVKKMGGIAVVKITLSKGELTVR